MTRDLDTHWKLHWMLVSRQGLGIWMSFMTWIRLTVHWIVSDCDLGKVSVYTPSRDCVGLHMHVVGCVCVWNFGTKFFLRRGECKTRENSNFLKKGKMVISVKIQNFSRSRMMKRTSALESFHEI